MAISSKTFFVSVEILFLAAVASANTTPPAKCTPHPAIFENGTGSPIAVSCPPFTVPGGDLTGVTLTFEADYQFGGIAGRNTVDVTFLPAGPAGVTWLAANVKLTTGGARSSGPAPTGSMDAASGISAAAFAAAFNVNVTSEVTAGTVASSSGAASVVYTYTPPPPITLTCPFTKGTTGAPYISALVANGGVPPYTFSITSGTLPPGSSLNAVGDVQGTPTAAGTFNFTAQVVDSTGTAAGTTTAQCTITNTNPVFRTVLRPPPQPLPPTGACPDTGATVSYYRSYETYMTPSVTVVYTPGIPGPRVVVVNQVPQVVVREYPQEHRAPPGQPPYYLAFTDSSVRLADTYWVSDDQATLYYVTPAHALEQAPLNSLDRTVSQRLNCEKNLPLWLVPQVFSQRTQTFPDPMPVFPVKNERPVAQNGPRPGGYLGLEAQDIGANRAKELTPIVQVTEVVAGSPAANAGFESGDIVLDFNGRTVESAGQLGRLVNETPAGRQVTISVWRAGGRLTLTPTVGGPSIAGVV
jgi:PDZ domain